MKACRTALVAGVGPVPRRVGKPAAWAWLLGLWMLAEAARGGITINPSVASGGGGRSSSGTFAISATVGEPGAAPGMSGGRLSVVSGFWNLPALEVAAQALLGFQGRVTVDGVPFTGIGQFKFALVNADGSQSYWKSAVDSSPEDGEPDSAVGLTVSNGLYSVLLGDPAQMRTLDPAIFVQPDIRLRIWFNDGIQGFQLLAPDQRLGSVGFPLSPLPLEEAPSANQQPTGIDPLVEVPYLLTYQGRVAAGKGPFTGAGHFKFALVNADGSQSYWKNAVDSSPADGEPDTAVEIAVNRGLYSVLLGDPAQMLVLTPTMVAHPDIRLRVWFNDGSHGFQRLSPDSRLGSLSPLAQAPFQLRYQGLVTVGRIPFTGAAQVKFALVSRDGSQTYWTSGADTAPADGEPDVAIGVAVSHGLYSLLLGDPAQMQTIDAYMLAHPDIRLRVWFNDGTHGFQRLSPDHRLGSLPF